MKMTKQETLYHKDHGATLKHKCGKRIVALSLLYFLFFFYWPLFLFGLSIFWDNALLMMIITLLFISNSMITTQY